MPTVLHFLIAAALPFAEEPAPVELPPIYQRLAELRAIAEKPQIASAFGQVPIERIEFVRTDLYRVTAGKCRIEVRIVGLPVPDGVVGPRRFEVKEGKPVCG